MKLIDREILATYQQLCARLPQTESRDLRNDMFGVPPEVFTQRSCLQQYREHDLVGRATPAAAPFATSMPITSQSAIGIVPVSGCSFGAKSPTSKMASPSQTGVNNGGGSKGERYKTELCRTYEESGTCRYGDKCQFAHGMTEMRGVVRHPKYKTDLCRTFHTSGFCPYGARCHFIHGEQENQPQPTVSAPRAAVASTSPVMVRQQQVPVVRRPDVLDLLQAGRQNELTSFVNTMSSLLNLNGLNQHRQQTQALPLETGNRPFHTRPPTSNLSDATTYELLRMMVEQQLSKASLSPCPSPTISQYGSSCSSHSIDDSSSPICSPSSSSMSSSSLSSSYGWNPLSIPQTAASFDSLSTYSSGSAGSGSGGRTPPQTPDSPTMSWQDRAVARDFRLWSSVEPTANCTSYDVMTCQAQSKTHSPLGAGRAIRSIFA